MVPVGIEGVQEGREPIEGGNAMDTPLDTPTIPCIPTCTPRPPTSTLPPLGEYTSISRRVYRGGTGMGRVQGLTGIQFLETTSSYTVLYYLYPTTGPPPLIPPTIERSQWVVVGGV